MERSHRRVLKGSSVTTQRSHKLLCIPAEKLRGIKQQVVNGAESSRVMGEPRKQLRPGQTRQKDHASQGRTDTAKITGCGGEVGMGKGQSPFKAQVFMRHSGPRAKFGSEGEDLLHEKGRGALSGPARALPKKQTALLRDTHACGPGEVWRPII